MPFDFYSDPEYKSRQSIIAKKNWKLGKYKALVKNKIRNCKNTGCTKTFIVKPADPKLYCSCSCAAHINNAGRIQSYATRQKISKSVLLSPVYHNLTPKKKPRVLIICKTCGKKKMLVPYMARKQKYCSVHCSITATGKLTTSPKASKGKDGIRQDIDPNINFYSTWEANMARVYNLVGIKWQYSPKIFDLGEHTYRPDFFLPKFETFVEVKNYLGAYSLMRDALFRQKYPKIRLDLILKEHYLEIKKYYKDLVDRWEY